MGSTARWSRRAAACGPGDGALPAHVGGFVKIPFTARGDHGRSVSSRAPIADTTGSEQRADGSPDFASTRGTTARPPKVIVNSLD